MTDGSSSVSTEATPAGAIGRIVGVIDPEGNSSISGGDGGAGFWPLKKRSPAPSHADIVNEVDVPVGQGARGCWPSNPGHTR